MNKILYMLPFCVYNT